MELKNNPSKLDQAQEALERAHVAHAFGSGHKATPIYILVNVLQLLIQYLKERDR